jgi:hypothetical protein
MKCRRRCALCYGLNNDYGEKRGQLVHIDRNGENINENNATFLCALHHDLYDSTSYQTKGFMPGELKEHQDNLLAYVMTIKSEANPEITNPTAGIALDVYDRRAPIYRKTRQFIRDVAENLRPDLKVILQFAADTDEALFLFDEDSAGYLETLFKKALRLRTIELMRERMHTHPDEAQNFQAMVQEETALAVWFTEQPEETRARFARFLRLA